MIHLGRLLTLATIGTLGLVAFLWIGFGPGPAFGLGLPAGLLLGAGLLLKRGLDRFRALQKHLRGLIQTLSLHHGTLMHGPEPGLDSPGQEQANREALASSLRTQQEELRQAVHTVPGWLLDGMARYGRCPSRLNLAITVEELGHLVVACRRSEWGDSAETLERLLTILGQENLLGALRLQRAELTSNETDLPPVDYWGTD